MKIALGQLAVSDDKPANLAKLATQVEAAARAGARLAVFPEASMHEFGAPSDPLGPVGETLEGPFATRLRELAREFGLSLVAGMFETVPDDSDRVYNTVLAVDERGELYGTYRKIHLYDALGFLESGRIAPGSGQTLTFTCEGVKFGVLTCYDVRFPEMARHLTGQGVHALLMPTAWLGGVLKELHLETLVRARAIENTVYVFCSDQVGTFFSGNSRALDPMGVTLASAGETETVIVAELSLERLEEVRAKLPSVCNRRPDVYAAWG